MGFSVTAVIKRVLFAPLLSWRDLWIPKGILGPSESAVIIRVLFLPFLSWRRLWVPMSQL